MWLEHDCCIVQIINAIEDAENLERRNEFVLFHDLDNYLSVYVQLTFQSNCDRLIDQLGYTMEPGNESRVKKALYAMERLGISPQTVKPVLKRLLRLYNRNWELIEEDNFRTLADAIFEDADDEVSTSSIFLRLFCSYTQNLSLSDVYHFNGFAHFDWPLFPF